MARKKITFLDPLFIRMLLDTTADDINLNISQLIKKEDVLGVGADRLRRFWRDNKNKFELDFTIELKEEYQDSYQTQLSEFDINDDETIGAYIYRKEQVQRERDLAFAEEMRLKQT